MLSSLFFLAAAGQGPDKLIGLATDPWLQLTSTPSGMVVEFITHSNPRITIDAGGLYVKKVENMALKTDDLELQKFVIGSIKPNSTFSYSLVEGNARVTYTAHAAKDEKMTSRLAIFGNSGSGSPQQKQIASLIQGYDPDLIVHVGDVVYPYGQEPDYLKNHFAVYSNTLSRTPMVAAAGDHDAVYRDYAQYPAGLCYYKFFNLPKTSLPWQRDLGNYSFSYGSAFWVVLDSNTHNNWSDPRAQAWLRQELARGAKATWRFVAFHHAPWHSSTTHADETHMRVLDPIFKQAKVNIVFSGHVQNYQRARPDAAGPYYVVSGAAGAELEDQDVAVDKTKWKPFTQAYASGYSYTQFEYDQKNATLKQVGSDGSVIDSIKLSTATAKPTPPKTTKPAGKQPAKSSSKKKG